MIIEVLLLTIILFLCSYILFGVLSSNEDSSSIQRRTFAFMVFWIIFWVVTILLTDIFYESLQFSLWTSRLSFTSSALIAYSYYFFVKKYQNGSSSNITKWIWGIVTAFFVVMTFTDRIVKSVSIVDNALKSEPGSMHLYFSIFTGVLFLISVTIFFLAYRKEQNKVKKTQMLYILVGSVISIVFTFVTNLVLPILGFKEIRSLGPLGLSFFIFGTYYSIIRYRFLSTKLLISKFLYTLLLALVPYAIFHLLVYLQTVTWGSVYATGALISGYFYALIFLFVYMYTSKGIEGFIKKIFYGSSIDPEEEKSKLMQNLDTLLDTYKVLEESKNLLQRVFSVKTGIVVVASGEIMKNFQALNTYEVNDEYVGILNKLDNPVLRDESLYLEGGDYEITNMLSSLKVQCLFPINITQNMDWKVYIFMGDKKDSSNYSIQDIDYIHSIALLVSVALQRAHLHQEVLSFNETLQVRINKATEDLMKKFKELEEARKKESNMIDIMGHELRTPATVVKINVEMLGNWKEKTVLEEAEIKHFHEFDIYTKRIRESIENEIRIINVLLVSAKLEGEKLELFKTPVDILNTIELGIEGQRKKADLKGISLLFNTPENPKEFPYVLADKGRVQEIVDNLINNAVKYTDVGSVTVSVTYDDQNVFVSVTDTGKGIAEENIPKLGTKFFRTDQYISEDNGSAQLVRPGGTGLGLYVVYGLVKAHGGEMKVTSELGKGSTFTFNIPIARGATEEVTKNVFGGDQFERLKAEGKLNERNNEDSKKTLQELLNGEK